MDVLKKTPSSEDGGKRIERCSSKNTDNSKLDFQSTAFVFGDGEIELTIEVSEVNEKANGPSASPEKPMLKNRTTHSIPCSLIFAAFIIVMVVAFGLTSWVFSVIGADDWAKCGLDESAGKILLDR